MSSARLALESPASDTYGLLQDMHYELGDVNTYKLCACHGGRAESPAMSPLQKHDVKVQNSGWRVDYPPPGLVRALESVRRQDGFDPHTSP